MKRIAVASAVLWSLVVTMLSTSPAHAGTGTPTLVSPSVGSAVAYGWNCALTIDYSGVGPGNAVMTITGPTDDAGNQYTQSFSGVENSDTQSYTVPAPTVPGSYCVTGDVSPNPNAPSDPNWTGWYGTVGCFTMSEPVLTISEVSQRFAAFYPTVHDGYKDTTSITYTTNAHATAVLTVKNSAGATVFSHSYGTQGPGQHTLPWSGKSSSGVMLKPGSYVLGVALTGATGTAQFTRPVAIKTGYMTWAVNRTQVGNGGHYSASGTCTVRDDTDGSSADLDCWGRGSAQVLYGMAIPANATNIRASVQGHRTSGADICCDGTIQTLAARTSARWVSFGARINGWRAFTLVGFSLSYDYRARI